MRYHPVTLKWALRQLIKQGESSYTELAEVYQNPLAGPSSHTSRFFYMKRPNFPPLSASGRPEYVIIPRWFTVHHMRGGTLSEAGGVGPMNAVRRSTAARPLERARARSSWAIAAPWLRTR